MPTAAIIPSHASLPTAPVLPAPHPDRPGGFAALLKQAAGLNEPLGTRHAASPPQGSPVPGEPEGGQGLAAGPTSPPAKDHGQLAIGTIGPDSPTVSHLLTRNPQLKNRAWEIIFAPVNRHKPYTSLRPGTQVAIDLKTQELLFSPAPPANQSAAPAHPTPAINQADSQAGPASQDFGERLAASVKSYLGTPYSTMNCYDLVVRGLEDQGVAYSGAGGLRQRLTRLAETHGLPENAYRNGEGLIAAGGEQIYQAVFPRIKDATRQAEELMHQLAPRLKEGMLLSFSTPTQGHTGIIANKNGQWTYVNSGMIDHQVDGGGPGKRVGEERLAAELENWFKLARRRGASLMVSVGRLDPGKLTAKGGGLLAGQHLQVERKKI